MNSYGYTGGAVPAAFLISNKLTFVFGLLSSAGISVSGI